MKCIRAFLIFLCINLFFVSELLAKEFYTKEDLKRIFLKEIKNKLFWVKGKIYLEDFRVEPANFKIPSKAKLKLKFFGRPRIGSNVAIGEFYSGNKRIGIVRIWAYVEAKAKVVVANKFIINKAILTKDDIRLEEKKLSQLPQGVIFDINEVLGKQIKMSVSPGRVLLKNYIGEPPLIRRGEVVLIVARNKYLVVKAKGVALQDGYLNQKIKVKNIASKKVVVGKVISPKEVEVVF